jgi:putative redox protein
MTLLDASPVTSVTAAERATRLTEAGTAWGKRIAANVANGQLTYRVRGTGEGSVASTITAGKHSFRVDEPAALAGDDIAASPVEFALGALISCQIVVYRLYAQALGIRVDEIDVKAEGDLDARYQELRAAVDAHCPVLDLFANATPVTVSVAKA